VVRENEGDASSPERIDEHNDLTAGVTEHERNASRSHGTS
jgi:hypothetical protein